MSRFPRSRVVVPGVVAACAVAGTLTALLLSSGPDAVAARAPGRPAGAVQSQPSTATLPPAPGPGDVVVTQTGGTKVTCPHGAVPTVTLTGASFEPALTGGTSFVPGRYRIRLVGTVDDETGAAVDVRGVRLTLGGRTWSGKPVVATRVAANSSTPLVIEGGYVAKGTERVDLRAELDWRWADPRLSACGEKGLIEDD
jgi:hypothetical protein